MGNTFLISELAEAEVPRWDLTVVDIAKRPRREGKSGRCAFCVGVHAASLGEGITEGDSRCRGTWLGGTRHAEGGEDDGSAYWREGGDETGRGKRG